MIYLRSTARRPGRLAALGLILAGLLSLSPLPAHAAHKRRPTRYVHIRKINIDVRDVFDPAVPGEDRWPFTWANFIHIRTRSKIILRALLVKPGQTVDEELLEESERNLRALPFIKDAQITEVPAPNGQVDLVVKTQDTWTTQPQINYGTEGNQNHFSAGMLEENVLGYGKSLSYFYRKDSGGVAHDFSYVDPQIQNTRLQLSSELLDTPTGNEQHVTFARPFYSLETRAAGGITTDHVKVLQKVFENGSQISQYDTDHLNIDAFGGLWINNDTVNVQRLQLDYRFVRDRYYPQATTLLNLLPANKTQSSPVLTWTLQQSNFIKETFADKAGRVEDINLGHQVTLGAGYSARQFGATENTLPLSAFDSFGFGGDGPWFGLMSYGMSGRYDLYASQEQGGHLRNTLYFGNFNMYRHLLPEFPLTGVLHLESAYLQNGDTPDLLQLGGDTGLRGFKTIAFTGNKSLLLNLESRFYYPREILHLAYLGGAAFVDAGEVQPQGLGFTSRDAHVDLGLGMRVALSRSTVGSVFRFDLAYAVGPVQQSNRWVFSISSGQGFNRAGNTYALFPGVPTQ